MPCGADMPHHCRQSRSTLKQHKNRATGAKISSVLNVGHHLHTHLVDAVVGDLKYKKTAATKHKRLLIFWEIALNGKKHTGKRLGIFGHFRIVVGVEVGDAEKIGKGSDAPSKT